MEQNKILLVSATEFEIKPIIEKFASKIDDNIYSASINSNPIEILITGVGIHAMTYALTKRLSKNQYKFIILAGISGAFSTDLQLGKVVNVMSERFSDLGVNADKGFKSIFDMGLNDPNTWPYTHGAMQNYTLINNAAVEAMTAVDGSTVQSIQIQNKCAIATNADVESMEGAAFYYCCMMEKMPFIQIRSISNFVGEQDKSKWNIPRAIKNLNNALVSVFEDIGN